MAPKKLTGSTDEDVMIGSLGGERKAPKKNKLLASQAAPADIDDDAMLGTLGKKQLLDGTRPRYDRDIKLVADVVLGYHEDEPDPSQSGATNDTQSKEISRMMEQAWEEPPPIEKSQRSGRIWVARTESKEGVDKYSMDPDQMLPCITYKDKDSNVCDICGKALKEKLFEFRCYRPRGPGQSGIGRTLLPFISYVGKDCGKGLLGVRSDSSRFREMVYKYLTDPDPSKVVQDFYLNSPPNVQRLFSIELQRLADLNGRATTQEEFRRAEQTQGPLYRFAEDPFRIMARAAQVAQIGARNLAGVAVMVANESGMVFAKDSYMSLVKEALQNRSPIPGRPLPWKHEDILATLQCLTKAWKVQASLFSNLHEEKKIVDGEVIETSTETTLPVLKLMFLGGSGALHASQTMSFTKAAAMSVKEARKEDFERQKAVFGSVSATVGKGPTSKEDRIITIPDVIEGHHVLDALQTITWPTCLSRKNVRPNGVDSIEAFMIGLIKPYFLSLRCSTRTRLLPNLATLLARFGAQKLPDFRYTSIQLNKNYNAKMHVDKNNHGPSYIIGLGDYEDGKLWVYDEEQKGPHEMVVTEKMPGWGHLLGKTVRGHLHDIKNKWVKFNGNLPHVALNFTKTRISIVYFTRKGWLDADPDIQRQLAGFGVPVPGEDWKSCGTVSRVDEGKAAAGKAVGSKEKVQEDSDSEVDEDIQMHLEGLPKSSLFMWAMKVREVLDVTWDSRAFSVNLCASRAGLGPGVALALQELLPYALKVTCLAEAQNEDKERGNVDVKTILKVAKHGFHPSCAFSTFDEFLAGKGFCEVSHAKNVAVPTIEEDLFFGSFSLAPFVGQELLKRNLSDDSRTFPLKMLETHIKGKRPAIVLLEAQDWENIPPKNQPKALSFLLDDNTDNAAWGLRCIEGYSVDFMQANLQDFGLPIASSRLFVIMVRKDCGTADDLSNILTLSRLIASQLPKSVVQDVLLDEKDPWLARAQESWQQLKKPANVGTKRSAAYANFLRQAKGDEFVERQWFPHGTPSQREQLNRAFEKAEKSGMDVGSLLVDFAQKDGIRDDGLLPSTSSNMHYSFLQHRQLTGLEELLVRGLPVSQARMQLKYFGDAELRHLALSVTPPSVVGVLLGAALAVAKLPGKDTRIPQARLADLLQKAPPLPEGVLSIKHLSDRIKADGDANQTEADHFSSRAVALLNLVGSMQAHKDKAPTGDDAPLSKAQKDAAEALKKAAAAAVKEAPDIGEALKDGNVKEAKAETADARDWNTRKRWLQNWATRTEIVSSDQAMRWVLQAAEDDSAKEARAIILNGGEYLKKIFAPKKYEPIQTRHDRLKKAFGSEDVIQELLQPLVDEVAAVGERILASDIDSAAREVLFHRRFEREDEHVLLKKDMSPDAVEKYVKDILTGLKSKEGRQVFLKHLADSITKRNFTVESFTIAMQQEVIDTWLADDEIFQPTVESPNHWPHGLEVLHALAKNLPGTLMGVHSKLLARAKMFENAETKVREEMVKHVLDGKGVPNAGVLDNFIRNHPQPDAILQRFRASQTLLDNLEMCKQEIEREENSVGMFRKKATEWEIVYGNMATCAKNKDDSTLFLKHAQLPETEMKAWMHLTKVESDLANKMLNKLQSFLEDAVKREEKEILERQEQKKKIEQKQLEEEEERRIGRLHGAIRQVQSVMTSYGWTEGSKRLSGMDPGQDFEALKDKTRELGARLQELQEVQIRPGDDARAAETVIKQVQDAALFFCQRTARVGLVRQRLRNNGLSQGIEALETAHMLDRLHEAASSSELLDDIGLSLKEKMRIKELVDEGAFNEEKVTPPVPRGYVLAKSRTNLLSFLKSTTPNSADAWDWPWTEPVVEKPRVLTPPATPVLAKASRPAVPDSPKKVDSPKRVEEGFTLPRVHVDFPWFTEDQNGIIENGGKLYCHYCGIDVSDVGVEEHTNLARRAGKDHDKKKQYFFDALKCLRTDGWKLHNELIRFEGKEFYCKPCDKTGPWWDLFHSPPHIETKTHIHKRNQCGDKASVPPEQRKKWQQLFEDLISQGSEICHKCAEVGGGGRDTLGEPSPKKAKKVEDRQSTASSSSAPAQTEPPPRNKPAPELPVPYVDFPWLTRAQDGMAMENGKLYCHYCTVPVASREEHAWKKDHGRWRDHFHNALDAMKTDGWKLDAEGITIKNKKYSCKHCSKEGDWWDLFHDNAHINTKNHRRYAGYVTPIPENDPHRVAWRALFASLEAGHAEKMAGEENEETAPKRPRTLPPSSSSGHPKSPAQATPKATAAPKALAASRPVSGAQSCLPKSAAGYNDAPDAATVADAISKAGFRYMPPLPDDNLTWGYFRKPNLWMWCKSCKTYTAIIEFNSDHGKKVVDNGSCVHYTAEVAAAYDAQLEKLLKW